MAEKHTHTPGPWRYDEIPNADGTPSRMVFGPSDLGSNVSEVVATTNKARSTYEADARLIAQAPAMLRELERMVEHFSVFASDHSMDASTETWAALHCAKEVIAAASGEAP